MHSPAMDVSEVNQMPDLQNILRQTYEKLTKIINVGFFLRFFVNWPQARSQPHDWHASLGCHAKSHRQ